MATTTTLPTGNARTVAGFMAIAIVFTVIGIEIKGEAKTSNPTFSQPFVVIAGGTFATGILALIAEAGDTGRQFAIGLAGLALVTAVLVNGGPVWKAAEKLVGGTNTGTTTPIATPTTATPTTATTAPAQ